MSYNKYDILILLTQDEFMYTKEYSGTSYKYNIKKNIIK